jgi:hypothetical protein
VRLGPVVSGGGVELEELEVLDVLDDEPGGRVVVVEDRVVAVVVAGDVAEVAGVSVGTAVGLVVDVAPVGIAVGPTAATALAVLQVSSGRVAGSAEFTTLAVEIHAGVVSRSG